MKIGILLVGPRGAGKSTYASHIAQEHPEVTIFDRDAFFKEHYPEGFDPYSGFISYAISHFWQMVAEGVENSPNSLFVFDCFTGWAKDRANIVAHLKTKIGLDQVHAHFLTTSLERTVQQYASRPGMKESGLTEISGTWDYELFWKNAHDFFPTEEHPNTPNPFDHTKYINPEQGFLPGMPLL